MILIFYILRRLPPSSTLFPYTTLFRSLPPPARPAGRHPQRDAPHAAEGQARQPLQRLRRMRRIRSEEHTSELQSRVDLVCRLLLEKKKHVEAQQHHNLNLLVQVEAAYQ